MSYYKANAVAGRQLIVPRHEIRGDKAEKSPDELIKPWADKGVFRRKILELIGGVPLSCRECS